MSRTQPTKRAKDNPLAYYETPGGCVDALYRELPQLHRATVDPSAGTVSLLRGVQRAGGAAVGVEIDPDRAALAMVYGSTCYVGDGLSALAQMPGGQDVIQNPPFHLSAEFCQLALTHHASLAQFISFTSLLASTTCPWGGPENRPPIILGLTPRPFADATSYAWAVWPRGWRDIPRDHKQSQWIFTVWREPRSKPKRGK